MAAEPFYVGLLCSDTDLVEYYVRLIIDVRRYTLKAIWSPDTERSIQIAADNEVPSVSHTAYQLISRNDINTVIIAGHSTHNAIFCLQTQASKKYAICIGAVALCERTAQLLREICDADSTTTRLRIVYPLRYSPPWQLITANLGNIGTLQSVTVHLTFRWPIADAARRLHCDANTMRHRIGHDLLAAIASLCTTRTPRPLVVTCEQREATVEHFGLSELHSLHAQVAFGATVCTISALPAVTNSLSVRAEGDHGTMMLDDRLLILKPCDRQPAVLWRGDGTFETIMRDGIVNALNESQQTQEIDELELVKCLTNCVFL